MPPSLCILTIVYHFPPVSATENAVSGGLLEIFFKKNHFPSTQNVFFCSIIDRNLMRQNYRVDKDGKLWEQDSIMTSIWKCSPITSARESDSSATSLYLEFGGKLFDDYHASRVLPALPRTASCKCCFSLQTRPRSLLPSMPLTLKKIKSAWSGHHLRCGCSPSDSGIPR